MGPQDILALREGYTVADASNVFDASFDNNPKLIIQARPARSRRSWRPVRPALRRPVAIGGPRSRSLGARRLCPSRVLVLVGQVTNLNNFSDPSRNRTCGLRFRKA